MKNPPEPEKEFSGFSGKKKAKYYLTGDKSQLWKPIVKSRRY